MNVHTNKVTSLKNQFVDQYKSNEANTIQLLREMRIIHGCAIYDDVMDKQRLMNKSIHDVTDDEWIKLSTNASLLHCIHHTSVIVKNWYIIIKKEQ